MFLLRVILFPFAVLYDLITRLRNRLYDVGLKPSTSFSLPVIGIGNLAVGGSGKTPMTEYLVRLLQPKHHIATLSRGYGRQTRGIRIAAKSDNADTVGDEPYQLFRKFPGITVAVGEDRVLAIPDIVDRIPETDLVLLDDAFQHRRLKAGFEILVTDYNQPFYKDYLLPAGRLRESRWGARRADVIVITKCPADLSGDDESAIRRSVSEYAACPIFFSRIQYQKPVSFGGHSQTIGEDVLLVTGIANAAPIKRYAMENFHVIRHIAYPDHYRYSLKDLRRFSELIQGNMSILTTEKDMVKLSEVSQKAESLRLPFFYLPIELSFMKNGEDFEALIRQAAEGRQSKNGLQPGEK
jgi:tetraacyldisaccharide 4'-kinase